MMRRLLRTSIWLAAIVLLLCPAQTQANQNLVSYVLEHFDVRRVDHHRVIPALQLDATGGELVPLIARNQTFHSNSSLRIDYSNDGGDGEHSYVVQSILDTKAVYMCRGAQQLSFAYKHRLDPEAAPLVNDLQWVFTLFDSENCADACSEAENLEGWEFHGNVLAADGVWNTVTVDLSDNAWRPIGSGNQVLDLNRLKGWRLKLVSGTSNLAGRVFVDQISLDGGGEMFGNIFHTDSFAYALDTGVAGVSYHNSDISEQESTTILYDGNFFVNYTVEQTETWGGHIGYDFLLPGRSSFNLSRAESVSMNYHIIKNASVQDRLHLRLRMLDSSHCPHSCGDDSSRLENYYSFHHVLDNAPETRGSVVVELQGDTSSESPFWRTGWFGTAGNDVLDRSRIQGFSFEVSMNSQGQIGSLVRGAFELTNVKVNKEFEIASTNTSECVVESGLRLLHDHLGTYEQIEFLSFTECCNACTGDERCNVAFSDTVSCFKAESIPAENIALASDLDSHQVAFVKKSHADFCDVCECRESDLTIDCRGRDLVLVPGSFNPGEETAPGLPVWTAQVLDLRHNPRLTILGLESFGAVDFIEELRLPANITYFSEKVLRNLYKLQRLRFEGDDDEALAKDIDISNVVVDHSGSFSDVCCGLGDEISLSDSSSSSVLTFCDLEPDKPGVDAVYEDFIQYFQARVVDTLRPDAAFLSEAAESKFKCAETCNLRSDCNFFTFDSRVTNTNNVCKLLADSGTPTRVCCEAEHYADRQRTQPGWVSGRVARTRHALDNARVLLKADSSMIADEASNYKTTFQVSLGSMPLRGAVWVEPRLTTVGSKDMEVVFSPAKAVLYSNGTSVTIEVVVTNAGSLQNGGILGVENFVQSCDVAFSTGQSLPTLFIEVVLPNEDQIDYLWIYIGVSLSVIVLMASFFFVYAEVRKRQSDSFWHVKMSELSFSDPPQVVGVGSFGFVLLAEYRGTEVAVKRVLPHRRNKKLGDSSSGAVPTVFERASWDQGSSVVDETTVRVLDDVELGMSGGSLGNMQHRWKDAMRSSKRDYRKLRQDFILEMRHLSKLRHPCITTVMGAVVSSSEPMLVMEYMDYGSLYDLLRNETVVLEGEQILPILRDIAQGIRFLHAASPKVIHCDLKSKNILVDSRLRAKVADFGLSQKKRLGASGTPFWMAPELLRGESTNTTQSDVYAFGVTLNEVYTRMDPYEDVDELDFAQVLEQVSNPAINRRPAMSKTCPAEIKWMIRDCVDADPVMRPTFKDLDLKLRSLDFATVEPATTTMSRRRTSMYRDHSERLLEEVFPPHVAKELREGRKVTPESREMVTIVFSDIVGFTDLSSTLSAMAVSDMLDRLYTKFDDISHKHDVFKVETIGDAWMGVTNLIMDQPDHVDRIAAFALDALRAAHETLIDTSNPDLGCVNLRLGFHSGPVVASVVGSRNPRYCLFGDTVNTAARMESNSSAGRIQCSKVSAMMLSKQNSVAKATSRGRISIKGKGQMETFWVSEFGLSDVIEEDHSSSFFKTLSESGSLHNQAPPPESAPYQAPPESAPTQAAHLPPPESAPAPYIAPPESAPVHLSAVAEEFSQTSHSSSF